MRGRRPSLGATFIAMTRQYASMPTTRQTIPTGAVFRTLWTLQHHQRTQAITRNEIHGYGATIRVDGGRTGCLHDVDRSNQPNPASPSRIPGGIVLAHRETSCWHTVKQEEIGPTTLLKNTHPHHTHSRNTPAHTQPTSATLQSRHHHDSRAILPFTC